MNAQIPSRVAFSLPMSYSLTLPSASAVPQTTLPQHLSTNLHNQSIVSLEELANLTGYPSVPRNYARNPSAFQQAYQDSTVFHDSLSNMGYSHAQYKTGVSRSNLPMSDVNISGYGGLGIPANFPGAVLQAAAPTVSAGGYDIFHSQYQDRNNFTTRQQVMVIGFLCFCMNIHFALSCDLWKLFTLSSVLKRDFFNLLSFAFVILSIKKKNRMMALQERWQPS